MVSWHKKPRRDCFYGIVFWLIPRSNWKAYMKSCSASFSLNLEMKVRIEIALKKLKQKQMKNADCSQIKPQFAIRIFLFGYKSLSFLKLFIVWNNSTQHQFSSNFNWNLIHDMSKSHVFLRLKLKTIYLIGWSRWNERFSSSEDLFNFFFVNSL